MSEVRSKPGTSFKNSIFDGARIETWRFNEKVQFSGASFQRTVFANVELKNSDFRKADLQNAKLFGVALGGSDFTGAKFTGARFNNTDISGCDLSKAIDWGTVEVGRDKIYYDKYTRFPPGFVVPNSGLWVLNPN
ncbi:MAG: pentapeptide repeat-containing protein [Burkholderiales bacterium]|nr:pentapeptide repeat-containing protein [Burkholderiales bacterium]